MYNIRDCSVGQSAISFSLGKMPKTYLFIHYYFILFSASTFTRSDPKCVARGHSVKFIVL